MPKSKSKYPQRETARLSSEQQQLIIELSEEKGFSKSKMMRRMMFGRNGDNKPDPEVVKRLEKVEKSKTYYKTNSKFLAQMFQDASQEPEIQMALLPFLCEKKEDGSINTTEDGTPVFLPEYFEILKLMEKLKIKTKRD